jgi:hypothetical protein
MYFGCPSEKRTLFLGTQIAEEERSGAEVWIYYWFVRYKEFTRECEVRERQRESSRERERVQERERGRERDCVCVCGCGWVGG